MALSPRAVSAIVRCWPRSAASCCAVWVTASDVACSCSADAASCSANAAPSSASRCTVEMVAPISSSIRLKLFSRKPSSSDSAADARTARNPCSASPITPRARRMRSISVAGIRFSAIATTMKTTVSTPIPVDCHPSRG